jgi:glycyl-tRNA synthetase beta subunit
VRNIARELGEQPAAPTSKTKLKEPAEVALAAEIERHRAVIETAVTTGRDFKPAYAAAAGFEPVVARFFEDVFVMSDDLELRQARLSLLKELETLVLQLGDISEIVAAES